MRQSHARTSFSNPTSAYPPASYYTHPHTRPHTQTHAAHDTLIVYSAGPVFSIIVLAAASVVGEEVVPVTCGRATAPCTMDVIMDCVENVSISVVLVTSGRRKTQKERRGTGRVEVQTTRTRGHVC